MTRWEEALAVGFLKCSTVVSRDLPAVKCMSMNGGGLVKGPPRFGEGCWSTADGRRPSSVKRRVPVLSTE
jgi:hypothetical protein